MPIRVALNHRTFYHYDREVTLGPQVVRLRPAPHCRTPIVSYSLTVTPDEHFINWQQDPQNNRLARLVIPKPTRKFGIEVDLVADMTVINPFDFFLEASAEQYPFRYGDQDFRDLRPYMGNPELGPKTQKLYERINLQPQRTIDFLVQVNGLVNRTLGYTVRMDPGVWDAERTLAEGKGSCRDFAWLMVQLYRKAGLAARFVSGYSIQLAPDVKPVDPNAPAGVTKDVCDLHAWVEVYLPGAGWVGLDATSGLMCGEGHIPLATSADATGAPPIEGGVGKAETEFDVSMSVTRVHEDPRVTKPYFEAQWEAIDTLGAEVDRRLDAGDVRLSMGGEPTFISVSDQEGEEWNTSAVGPTKKPISDALIRKFREHFAPGGLLHFGQGKWYPGEQLPRWALGLYWRRDGEPIWNDDSLIGDESKNYGHTPEHAKNFLVELCKELDISDRFIASAYEDPVSNALSERQLPINVDPLDSKLEDAEERARLLRVFERGLGTATAVVLPLEHGDEVEDEKPWHSGEWIVRGERLYLVPGNSPAGYRLPLASLPWVKKADYPYLVPADPVAQRPALPSRVELDNPVGERVMFRGDNLTEPTPTPWGKSEPVDVGPRDRRPEPGESAPWVVRTAMAVEPRDGRLYVFMPPLKKMDHYLELVAAVERAAKKLGLPVLLDGYTPPADPRVDVFKVTPDPGVIEVNVHPAHSWDQLTRITETVYDEARQAGLGTEKFQLDGRHTGTGGGNHLVVGGLTPADSPFLRRPELLKSLIGYWINHPSLSYLFSGLFVGPTSQAPRVDEGRPEAVDEMEIAFDALRREGTKVGEGTEARRHEGTKGRAGTGDGSAEHQTNGLPSLPSSSSPSVPSSLRASVPSSVAPWVVDRLFRNLLTDLTGNTHRAELCIDKMYSPDSTTGRLGLVEFRGFEMSPHPRMSLAQQLLLRALIAHFWQHPYEAKLQRWGTTLHDRFTLPHYVRQDFLTVLDDLQDAGLTFQPDWFFTHFEFRFPVMGTVEYDGVTMELRTAIEPWLTLGEAGTSGGQVRYVDSSLERLQVKLTGLDPRKHTLAVNGVEVPLHPTGSPGEFVAGVRYRAWQPPECLHPTIGVHAPLRFDLVSRAGERAVGGCVYHITHPGGRSHEQVPVNALEAETRRTERFQPFGHTPGKLTLRQPPPPPRGGLPPVTLDLRRLAF